jgi:small GTP-binding protein
MTRGFLTLVHSTHKRLNTVEPSSNKETCGWKQSSTPYVNPLLERKGEYLSSGGFDYMRKVVMIGAGGSGKTALVNRFLTHKFSEEYIVTIGSQFAVKTVAVEAANGRNIVVKLLVWDLAGQQRFDFIRGSYYRGSKGALLVYDTTRKSTWLELPKWIKETEDALGERIPIILLANKVDLAEERVITREMGEEFMREQNLVGYLETSALTGQNVEEAFSILAKSSLSIS